MSMSEHDPLKLLGRVGAVMTDGHFVYASGKHGSVYVNKDAVYPHTELTSDLCYAIAGQFLNDDVDVVVAPEVAGVILSQWVAHHLTAMGAHEVLSTYAERDERYVMETCLAIPPGANVFVRIPGFVIKRGYDKLVAGENVLVVEDVLTTGGSVKGVVEAIRRLGGNIVGLGALCNRGGITSRDVVVPRLFALVNANLDAWPEANCPLCEEGVPINTDVGKGREFLARKGLR